MKNIGAYSLSGKRTYGLMRLSMLLVVLIPMIMMVGSSTAKAQTAPQGVWFTIYEADITVPSGTSIQHISVTGSPDNLRFSFSPNGTFPSTEDDTWYISIAGGSYSPFSPVCNYGSGGSAVASSVKIGRA